MPKNKFTFPLKIISSEFPIGIKYKAGVSAQLKSAVIFAGINSYGDTEITEEEKSFLRIPLVMERKLKICLLSIMLISSKLPL